MFPVIFVILLNLSKSIVEGGGCLVDVIQPWVDRLPCRVEQLPIMCLGLPAGVNIRLEVL